MLDLLKHLPGVSTTVPVFVIGTGRSGTHWLGYSLGDHPEVRATIEKDPMFRLATRMAVDPRLEKKLFSKLVTTYRWQLFLSSPRLYLDKSHPNIWLAEKLKRFFPRALFVGIERNPYATVASMIQHPGVSAWHQRWRDLPVPNRFLGITPEIVDAYGEMPLAAKCALRWIAHHDRIRQLQSTLGASLLAISYETFAENTQGVIRELQRFLGLRQPIPSPEVKTDSLHKWERLLSDAQIAQVQEIVGFPPKSVRG